MKKISMDELKQMLVSDKELAGRLKSYLSGEKDPQVVGEKTIEFLAKEGYELDKNTIEELSDDDLENVSGGFGRKDITNAAKKVGKTALGVGKVVGNYYKGLGSAYLDALGDLVK